MAAVRHLQGVPLSVRPVKLEKEQLPARPASLSAPVVLGKGLTSSRCNTRAWASAAAAAAAGVGFHRGKRRRARTCLWRQATPGPRPDDGHSLDPQPSDGEVDREFTASFANFVTAYYSPRARLLRWWHLLLGPPRQQRSLPSKPGGGRRQVSTSRWPTRSDSSGQPVGANLSTAGPPHRSASGSSSGPAATADAGVANVAKTSRALDAPASKVRGPLPQECMLAALSYLLPLAGGLRCARPLLEVYPQLSLVCAPFALLAAPLSSPLGASLAFTWLLCGVVDRRTVQSYFVRYNFCQALLLGSLLSLAGLPRLLGLSAAQPLAAGAVAGVGASAGVLELVLAGWALGVAVTTSAWSVGCCLLGRFPDRIPAISAVAHRRVRW